MHVTSPFIKQLSDLVDQPEVVRAQLLALPDLDVIKQLLHLPQASDQLKSLAPLITDVLWERIQDDRYWWDQIQSLGLVTKIFKHTQDPQWIDRLMFLWDENVPCPSKKALPQSGLPVNGLAVSDPNNVLAKTIHQRCADHPQFWLAAMKSQPLNNLLSQYYARMDETSRGEYQVWVPLQKAADQGHLYECLPHVLPQCPPALCQHIMDCVFELDNLDPKNLDVCFSQPHCPVDPVWNLLAMQWSWKWRLYGGQEMDEMVERFEQLWPYAADRHPQVSLDAKFECAKLCASILKKHLDEFEYAASHNLTNRPSWPRWKNMWRTVLNHPMMHADEVIHYLQADTGDEVLIHRAMDLLPVHAHKALARRLARTPNPILARHPQMVSIILTDEVDASQAPLSRPKKM